MKSIKREVEKIMESKIEEIPVESKGRAWKDLGRLFGFPVPLYSLDLGLDVGALDDTLSEADSEYDSENCVYKGNKCSMAEYVYRKYGADVLKKLKILI